MCGFGRKKFLKWKKLGNIDGVTFERAEYLVKDGSGPRRHFLLELSSTRRTGCLVEITMTPVLLGSVLGDEEKVSFPFNSVKEAKKAAEEAIADDVRNVRSWIGIPPFQ